MTGKGRHDRHTMGRHYVLADKHSIQGHMTGQSTALSAPGDKTALWSQTPQGATGNSHIQWQRAASQPWSYCQYLPFVAARTPARSVIKLPPFRLVANSWKWQWHGGRSQVVVIPQNQHAYTWTLWSVTDNKAKILLFWYTVCFSMQANHLSCQVLYLTTFHHRYFSVSNITHEYHQIKID